MDNKLRSKNRIKKDEYVKPPKIPTVPIGLIENCFSEEEEIVELSLTDLFHYTHLSCTPDELEDFCEAFPYDDFLEMITSLPECQTRQKALLIFSCCSTSDFFPSEQYSSDMDIILFFISLLDSSISEEVSSALQILSQIIIKCPEVCEFLVEEQKIHSKLEKIEATPQFAKMLAVISDAHPQSLELTLSLLPYCLQTHDSQTILSSLLAMVSAIKNDPECIPFIISLIVQYSQNLFCFDIENIEESGPYTDQTIMPPSSNEENNEENIQLLLQILSMVPEAPISLLTQIFNILLKCSSTETILLCNIVLRKHKEEWRGESFIDEMLCMMLHGMMTGQPFEVQKSCIKTIAVYYPWDNEINLLYTEDLVRFLEDDDMKSLCLFALCHLIEVYIINGSGEDDEENSLQRLSELLDSTIPTVEKIVSNSNEEEEILALSQRYLDLLSKGQSTEGESS